MRYVAFEVTLIMAASCFHVSPAHAQGNVVFSDQMEADTTARWNGNSCGLSPETNITCEGGSSLRLVDRGANAQAYVPLSTEPSQTYDVSARAYRLAGNKGDWFGKIAVSVRGGAVSSGNYLTSSAFIEQADAWETLRCTFTAPSNRVYLILVGQNATGDVTLFDDVEIRSAGGAMTVIEDSLVVSGKRIETVTLAGTPEQIGTQWGTINSAAIREDMEKYKEGVFQRTPRYQRAEDPGTYPAADRFRHVPQRVAGSIDVFRHVDCRNVGRDQPDTTGHADVRLDFASRVGIVVSVVHRWHAHAVAPAERRCLRTFESGELQSRDLRENRSRSVRQPASAGGEGIGVACRRRRRKGCRRFE